MNPVDEFERAKRNHIASLGSDTAIRAITREWFDQVSRKRYSYHFEWMGRPIIQFPQDVLALQEIIWKVKPDLIIETGIAHGGSVIFSSSMLELNAIAGGPQDAEVIAVDIEIRAHNRDAIVRHPMSRRITMLEGSSIDRGIIAKIRAKAASKRNILVCLDSNHTHDHVLAELRAYGSLTSVGSYCIVFDTCIEDMPNDMFLDRPWAIGNNPKTALTEYLASNRDFVIDEEMENKLLITVAPGGYLRRVG